MPSRAFDFRPKPFIGLFMTEEFFANAPDLAADDCLVLGLATCFIKDDGDVHEVQLIEPIPSGSWEAILKGIPTSYQMATAMPLGVALAQDPPLVPREFPADAQFCDEFISRTIATARTYKRRPVAQTHLALGMLYKDFNYSTERK